MPGNPSNTDAGGSVVSAAEVQVLDELPVEPSDTADPLAGILARAAEDEGADSRVRAWLERLLGAAPDPVVIQVAD